MIAIHSGEKISVEVNDKKLQAFILTTVVRLYDKTKVNYDTRADHAKVQSIKTHKTKCHIIHNTYESMDEWITKNELPKQYERTTII